jgi:hypothetical protein
MGEEGRGDEGLRRAERGGVHSGAALRGVLRFESSPSVPLHGVV